VRLIPEASASYDSQFDAFKLFSHETNAFQIFTKDMNNTIYAVNSQNHDQFIVLPLLLVDAPEDFALQISELSFIDYKVFLKDNELNSMTELSLNQEIRLSSIVANVPDRFELIFEKTATEMKELEEDVIIYPNPNTGNFYLYVNKGKESFDLSISDISGKVIFEKKENNGGLQEIKLQQQSKGIYFVKLKLSTGAIINKKVIIE